MKIHHGRAVLFLALMALLGAISARDFRAMSRADLVIPGSGVTHTMSLSHWAHGLLGSSGETPVYVMEGKQSGGTLMLVGGVHPNEASGFLAATIVVEHARVLTGRVIVIPQASFGGYTCTDPMEAYPEHYTIRRGNTERTFRYGSRGMNPVDQWPDPLVYLHYPSGQQLSGIETRNLNRCFPGRSDGTYTERVAHAIMQILRQEGVSLAIDLHEAAPEYPVINTIVAHQKGTDIAASAILSLELEDLEFTLERSPVHFHGLSHREWGDGTDAYAFLMETGNVMQGRLRGKTDQELLLSGRDPEYLRAAKIGMVKIPYDSSGLPIELRVGRHLQGVKALVDAYNEAHPDNSILIEGIPSYAECMRRGIGAFLNTPNSESSSDHGVKP